MVRLDPTYASGYHNRALIHQKRNAYDRALADFDKAAQFAPTEVQVFAMRGAILENMGELDRALADYRQAVRLAPTKPGGADAIRRVEQKIAARGPAPQGSPRRSRSRRPPSRPRRTAGVSPSSSATATIVTPACSPIRPMMRRVCADVVTATREKQVPWDHSSLIGEVILAR